MRWRSSTVTTTSKCPSLRSWKNSAEDAANIKWARDLWIAAKPHVSSAVYANHMTADEAPERVRSAYGPG